MSFPENLNLSQIFHLETQGTGSEEGSDGGRMSTLGAAGVAGADCLTDSEAAKSKGSISLLIGVVKSQGE